MADAVSTPARRVVAFTTVLLAGLSLGIALGSAAPNVRLSMLPSPTLLTIALVAVGGIAGALAVGSALALRLVASIALFVTAGLALTRLGAGPGVAFALAPVALWSSRVLRSEREFVGGVRLFALALGLGVGAAAPRIYEFSTLFTMPLVGMVASLAVAGAIVAIVAPGDHRPVAARFDLRAALAVATLVAVGFLVAFALESLTTFLTTPPELGGAGIRKSANALLVLAPLWTGTLAIGFWRGGISVCVGWLGVALALALVALSHRSALIAAILIVPLCLGLVLAPGIRRAERAHEALAVVTLLLATFLGMPLAAGIVRGFTRPLLGAVPGIGAATETNWSLVLGFYALLALVVLLAHLAHAYEFGFAALDPEDDRDPLPILRKGLPKLRPKA